MGYAIWHLFFKMPGNKEAGVKCSEFRLVLYYILANCRDGERNNHGFVVLACHLFSKFERISGLGENDQHVLMER